jgi:hypothetical protein
MYLAPISKHTALRLKIAAVRPLLASTHMPDAALSVPANAGNGINRSTDQHNPDAKLRNRQYTQCAQLMISAGTGAAVKA